MKYKNINQLLFWEEILSILCLKNNHIEKKGRSIGIMFDSNASKEYFAESFVREISSSNKQLNQKLKVFLAKDWNMGLINNTSIENNIIMLGLLLSMTRSQINKVKKKVLSDNRLSKYKDKMLSEISNIQKMLLAFSILNLSDQDIIIFDEWPVIIDSKYNIDTSDALLRLFLSASNISIKLSIYEHSFGSETNELFYFTNSKLFYLDNSKVNIGLY